MLSTSLLPVPQALLHRGQAERLHNHSGGEAALIVPKLSQEKQHFVGNAPGLWVQILRAAPQKQEENIWSQSTGRARQELQKTPLVWYKTQSVGHRALSNQRQPRCFPEGSQLAAGSSPALLGSHPAICLGTAS